MTELPELSELPVNLALPELEVQLARTARLVLREPPEPGVFQVRRARKVLQVAPAQRVPRVRQARQVRQALRGQKGPRALKVQPEDARVFATDLPVDPIF